MIKAQNQQELLLNIAQQLKRKITVYAIGGTAMMFRGLKLETKDIDLVFTNKEDRQEFQTAAEKLKYTRYNSRFVYGEKPDQPIMLNGLFEERIDLFTTRIINTDFSEQMMKRATQIHEFGNTLIVKIADPHDIIIMKCATDREKDKLDAKKIIDNNKIDWNIIIQEAENQVKKGNERMVFELGCFLEELKNRMRADIPSETLDRLYGLLPD
jgi:hypothetical protein